MPAYDLPSLLVSSEGKTITTPNDWFRIRRPQIISLFGNLLYGILPETESPLKISYEVVKTDDQFMNGLATRKDVRIRFQNARGKAEMLILVLVPKEAANAGTGSRPAETPREAQRA